MFRYNITVQTSFIFKENTALGPRLRKPNEESSLVANAKLTETIMAKLWALVNEKQSPLVKVNPLKFGGNKRSYIHKVERKEFEKRK